MANADMGEIRDMNDWRDMLSLEQQKALIPFEVDEKIEIKRCLFKVRSIHPHPNNMITLEMLPSPRQER